MVSIPYIFSGRNGLIHRLSGLRELCCNSLLNTSTWKIYKWSFSFFCLFINPLLVSVCDFFFCLYITSLVTFFPLLCLYFFYTHTHTPLNSLPHNIITSTRAADTECKAAMIYLFQQGALSSIIAPLSSELRTISRFTHINSFGSLPPPSPPSDISQPTLGKSSVLGPFLRAVKPGAELPNNEAEIFLQYTISAHSPSRNVGHSDRIQTLTVIMSVELNN